MLTTLVATLAEAAEDVEEVLPHPASTLEQLDELEEEVLLLLCSFFLDFSSISSYQLN